MRAISCHSKKCFNNIVIHSIVLVLLSTNANSGDNSAQGGFPSPDLPPPEPDVWSQQQAQFSGPLETNYNGIELSPIPDPQGPVVKRPDTKMVLERKYHIRDRIKPAMKYTKHAQIKPFQFNFKEKEMFDKSKLLQHDKIAIDSANKSLHLGSIHRSLSSKDMSLPNRNMALPKLNMNKQPNTRSMKGISGNSQMQQASFGQMETQTSGFPKVQELAQKDLNLPPIPQPEVRDPGYISRPAFDQKDLANQNSIQKVRSPQSMTNLNQVVSNSPSYPGSINTDSSLSHIHGLMPIPVSSEMNENDNGLFKKRCRKFDSVGLNIEANMISGDWNLFFTTFALNEKCIQISIKYLNENELEFREHDDCGNTFKSGILSKTQISSKLILTVNGRSSSFWAIDTGISDVIMVYQCLKPQNNSNEQISENYKVISRRKQLSNTIHENMTILMSLITTEMSLHPIPHLHCLCDQGKHNELNSTPAVLPQVNTNVDLASTSITPLSTNSVLPSRQRPSEHDQINHPRFNNALDFGPSSNVNPSVPKELGTPQHNDSVSSSQSSSEQPLPDSKPLASGSDSIPNQFLPDSKFLSNLTDLDMLQGSTPNVISKIEINNVKDVNLNQSSFEVTTQSPKQTSNSNIPDAILHSSLEISTPPPSQVSDSMPVSTSPEPLQLTSQSLPISQQDLVVSQSNAPITIQPNLYVSTQTEMNMTSTESHKPTSSSLPPTPLPQSQGTIAPVSKSDSGPIPSIELSTTSSVSSPSSLGTATHTEMSGSVKPPLDWSPAPTPLTLLINMPTESHTTQGLPLNTEASFQSSMTLSPSTNEISSILPTTVSITTSVKDIESTTQNNEIGQSRNSNIAQSEPTTILPSLDHAQPLTEPIPTTPSPTITRAAVTLTPVTLPITWTPSSTSSPPNSVLQLNSVYSDSSTISPLLSSLPTQVSPELDTSSLPSMNQQVHIKKFGCPSIEYVKFQYPDWERISGIWYSQWNSEDNHDGLTIEFGSIDSRTVYKRWQIIRQGTDLLTGVLELNPSTGEIVCTVCGKGVVHFYTMSTDYSNYMITYLCIPATKTFQISAWTRRKELEQTEIDALADATVRLVVKNRLNATLYAVNHFEDVVLGQTKIRDEFVCRDLCDKGVRNIDVSRLRGNWRTVLLNVEDVRCIGIKENKTAMTATNDKNEFWFDVYTEKGTQGLGRIKLYASNRLTQFNSEVPGERNFTILDTDYNSFFVYYECNIVEIRGQLVKIIEYGLMARLPNVLPEILSNAIEIFNENGLETPHHVDQKECYFNHKPIILKENYCRNLENQQVKIIDLDMIVGKWLGQYSSNSSLSDVWIDLERNPDFYSEYSHVLKSVIDDNVWTLLLTVDKHTGVVLMKDQSNPSAEELQFVLLDVNQDYFIIFKCHDLPGLFSNIPKFEVYSRECELNDSVRDRVKTIAQNVGVSDKLSKIKQYHCLLDYKYETRILSDKCIQFHDSELIDPELSRMVGQWDRHLMSEHLPHRYDYAMVTHKDDIIDYVVYPHQYHSHKVKVNGTNLLKTISVNGRYAVIGNEALLGVDYDSYILKYSCAQYEQNGRFIVKELLILSLRPQMSARLQQDQNIFASILNGIPEKSLYKVKPLIAKLFHQLNPKYNNFGQTVIGSVSLRLQTWNLDNSLSDKSDKEVYKFLAKNCDLFDEDEQIFFDVPTITSSNWTLDYTNFVDHRYPFDRLLIKKQGAASCQLSLYNRDKLTALLDKYYDRENRHFLSYMEGRRGRKTYLFSNVDYRIEHTCSERYTNGILEAKEILRFYSAENTRRPRDWFSYLVAMVSHLKPKTLGKLAHLLEELRPVFTGCDKQHSAPNSLMLSLKNYLSPKLHFEQQFRERLTRSAKSDGEVSSILSEKCRVFDSSEIVEPNLKRLSGEWQIDWANYMSPTREKGSYSIDIQPNSDEFIAKLYFSKVDSTDRQALQKCNFKPINQTKQYLKITESFPQAQFTILWTDYENYLITHQCFANEINGEMAISEIINLHSRKKSIKSRDLSIYFGVIANNLQQTTISKIYHLLNSLIPFDARIVAKDVKSIGDNLNRNKTHSETLLKERFIFAEDLYNNFMPKGLTIQKINKYVGLGFSKRNGSEVFQILSSTCRQFDDKELVEISPNSTAAALGNWRYDYITRTKFFNRYDNFEIDLNGSDYNVLEIKRYLGTELVTSYKSLRIHSSNWRQSVLPSGVHQISGILYLDSMLNVKYWCAHNDINGVSSITEGLIFLSRASKALPLDVYLSKLLSSVKPTALSKVVDLISNLRPVDDDIRNRDCHLPKLKSHKMSPTVVLNQILAQNCFYFSQRDLVEPVFKRLVGHWKVRLANIHDFHNPFDTIQWVDSTDRYFSKLRLGDKFVCKSKLAQLEDTNYFEEDFDRKRAIQAILYTDYSNVMVVYSCKENIYNSSLGVMENLKFLVKNDSSKLSMNLQDFQDLVLTKLQNNILSKIQKFIPTLKYVYYNQTFSDVPPDTHHHDHIGKPMPKRRRVIHVGPDYFQKGHSFLSNAIDSLSDLNVPEQLNPFESATNVNISTSASPTNSSDQEHAECFNLDGVAQHDIDFSRLAGHWDAIYTSNKRWDKDCISTDDVYDNTTQSLIQMKRTNGKTHRVVIRHSGSNGRQHIFVDSIQFLSWILATDYKTYRLSYTCYVRDFKGKKRRIELERLYTRNIEAKDFDPKVLEALRQKSLLIGKPLEPIERSNCSQHLDSPSKNGTSAVSSSVYMSNAPHNSSDNLTSNNE